MRVSPAMGFWGLFGTMVTLALLAPFYPAPPLPLQEETKSFSVSLRTEEIPADEVSKPYVYRSLKGLSDEELLRWMNTRGRTLWDVAAERAPKRVPEGFWEADDISEQIVPLVRANRPPEMQAHENLTLDREEIPPEEGTLAISDGPSGCFSGSGFYEYFLRCEKGRSSLTIASMSTDVFFVNPLEANTFVELRVIPLDDHEARRILQTAWWLGRVRAKATEGGFYASGMSSTSDGFARFRLETPGGIEEGSAIRYAFYPERYMAVEIADNGFGLGSRLNLIMQLVDREWRGQLGERWKTSRFENIALDDASKEQLEALRARVMSLLQEAVAGQFGLEMTAALVEMARTLGLETQSERAALRERVPKLTPRLEQLSELNRKIAEWQKLLGEAADSRHAYERNRAREAIAQTGRGHDPIPGIDLPRPVPPPDPRFDAVDRLYKERDRLTGERTSEEEGIGRLKDALDVADTWFGLWQNPEKLEALARTDQGWMIPAAQRLRKLDPERALQVVTYTMENEKHPEWKKQFQKAMDLLESEMGQGGRKTEQAHEIWRLTGLPEGAPPDAQIDSLIAVARKVYADIGIDEWTVGAAADALKCLVPENDPFRFPEPEVDEALLEFLGATSGKARYLWNDAAFGLALRGRVQYWDRLVDVTTRTEVNMGTLMFPEMLPALTMMAIKNSEKRQHLQELLGNWLKESRGSVDSVVWTAWLSELQGLKIKVEALATSGPDDAEGMYGLGERGKGEPESHRYHSARQVLSLWNEEDAMTRAKLLILASLFQNRDVPAGALREQWAAKLKEATQGFSREQLETLYAFLDWSAQMARKGKEANEVLGWLRSSLRPLGKEN